MVFSINKLCIFISSFYCRLLTLAFPSLCRNCPTLIPPEYILCNECLLSIKRCSSLTIPITKSKAMTVISLGAYEGILRRLIIRKHYRDYVASSDLAQLWISTLSLNKTEIDVIVPIPLHWTRKVRRGFNQAEIIARALGTHYSIPVGNFLSRTKRTRYQASLSSTEREENLKESFTIYSKHAIKGKRIIIVDDLCTTGATLKEATRILYKAGASSVNACVIARTV